MSILLVSLSHFIIANSAFGDGTASVLGHESDHDDTAANGNAGIYDDIIEGSNSFGYDLTNYLYKDTSTNIWISPFSITSCLSLLYPASNGKTKAQIANISKYPAYADSIDITQLFLNLQISIEQMYDGLRTNLYDTKPSKVHIINKLYISNGISLNPSYIAAITDDSSSISAIESNFDFTANNATSYINEWVNDESNGLIEEIIDNDGDISKYNLAAFSTLYLNGTFIYKFDPSMTSFQKFYKNGLRKQETIDIHLMHQIGYFSYYGGQYYQFLRIPLTDNNLFVLYALPIHHELYGEEDQNGLIHHGALIKHALNKLERTYVAVAVPRIAMDISYNLHHKLAELGMTDAFDANLADFSGMSPDEPLFVDTFVHKAMIEMNENGIFAAAASGFEMDGASAMHTAEEGQAIKPVLFKADHPFQVFIIDGDHDNAILFMGEINKAEIPNDALEPTFVEEINSIWNNFTVYIGGNEENLGGSNMMHSINIITLLFIFTLTLIL